MPSKFDDCANGFAVEVSSQPDYERTFNPDVFYDELEIIQELRKYVLSTYDQHYVGDAESLSRPIQMLDMWESIGSREDVAITCKNLAMKYMARFGKKGGRNKKDYLKAMHYIVLAWHFTDFDSDQIGE